MRVLLIGGNDTLRRSMIDALGVERHQVRLLEPESHASNWPAHVEPWPEAGGSTDALLRALRGCEAAIVVEPALASERDGNEDGRSSHVVQAARQAGIDRVVAVEPLSADRPAAAPETVRTSTVYGIGDDPVSLLLIMMRSLPAVPMPTGERTFRPVWHEDLARAVADSLAHPPTSRKAKRTIVGPEAVTFGDLYERIGALIDRRPLRIPVPEFLATYAARLTGVIDSEWLSRLDEEEQDVSERAGLDETTASSPTRLDEGLQRLIRGVTELDPDQGVGTLEIKRFSADIRDSRFSSVDLLRQFRTRFAEVMPVSVGVEPAVPATSLREGETLTMALPGRGHVQIRVEEVTADHVVVATLRGHVLAGVVRFSARDVAGAVRFEVMTCDRAANRLDWIALTLGGARLQDGNWVTVVENVVQLSGGRAERVESDHRKLEGAEEAVVTSRIRDIIERRRHSAA